jgi:hypothetical protein
MNVLLELAVIGIIIWAFAKVIKHNDKKTKETYLANKEKRKQK